MTFFLVVGVIVLVVLVSYACTQINKKSVYGKTLERFNADHANQSSLTNLPPSTHSWSMIRPNEFLKVVDGDPHNKGVPKAVYDSQYILNKVKEPHATTFFSNDGSRYGIVSDSSVSVYDAKSYNLLHTIPNPNKSHGPYKGGGLILSNNHVVLCRSERHGRSTHDYSDTSGECEYHNSLDIYTDSLTYKKSIGVIGVNARLIGVQYNDGLWYTCFLYENELSSDPVHLAMCEMYTPSPITPLDVRERLSIDINQESSDANELDAEYKNDMLVDTDLELELDVVTPNSPLPDNSKDDVNADADTTTYGGSIGFYGSNSYGSELISDRIRDREQDPIVLLPTKWTVRRRYDIKTSNVPLSVHENGTKGIRVLMDINHHTVYASNSNGLVGSFYLNRFSPTMHLRSIHKLV